jgi:hypothetical protein
VAGPTVRIDMVVAAAFATCLLVLFHERIRRVQGPGLAAVLTLVLLTVPAFWSNAVAAYADLPEALFLLGGAGLVYLWFDHDRRAPNLVLGGVLLAFAVWVKRDALVVWMAATAAILAFSAVRLVSRHSLDWRPALGYLAPVVSLVP